MKARRAWRVVPSPCRCFLPVACRENESRRLDGRGLRLRGLSAPVTQRRPKSDENLIVPNWAQLEPGAKTRDIAAEKSGFGGARTGLEIVENFPQFEQGTHGQTCGKFATS